MLALRRFLLSALLVLTGCVGYPYQPAGYGYDAYPAVYGQAYGPGYMAPSRNVLVPLAVPGPMYRPYNYGYGRSYDRPYGHWDGRGHDRPNNRPEHRN